MNKTIQLFISAVTSVFCLCLASLPARAEIAPETAVAINSQLSTIENAVNDGISVPITSMLSRGTSLSETLKRGIEVAVSGHPAQYHFTVVSMEENAQGVVRVKGNYSYSTKNSKTNGFSQYFDFRPTSSGLELVDTDLHLLGSFASFKTTLDGKSKTIFPMMIGVLVVLLLLGLLQLVAMWIIFRKAGWPGWATIVPIYNLYVILKIAGKSGWWILLMFIPLINFIVIIAMFFGVAKNFGKGALFGLGLLFFGMIFFPILAFGDSEYQPVS